MSQAIIKTAIEIAKNQHVQRIAIGFVVGGLVGYAIARTIEPLLFPEGEYEMFPLYDTPEQALLRDETETTKVVIPVKYEGASIGQVTSMFEDETGVTVTAKINPDVFKDNTGQVVPKTKYARPVKTPTPAVQQTPAAEKLAVLNTPAPKPVTSTFSSTREPLLASTGGGNPRKKVRRIDGE